MNFQQTDTYPRRRQAGHSRVSSGFSVEDIQLSLRGGDCDRECSVSDAHSNFTIHDYQVGKADSRHTTMVYEFLRLLCQEEPSQYGADGVLIVDIQGCIYGYGVRHHSVFAEMFSRNYRQLLPEMLSASMQRRWLNQNIDTVALQRRTWRLFRLHDTDSSHMVLMEFHPVEMQRTALVLWELES